MKKLFITLLLVLSILTIGCSAQISADTTVITPETVTVTSIVEIENTEKIEKLEADNFKLEAELEKYRELISGLNELLGNVYYGYASNSNWISDGFTAFSLKYNDKYYLITAGHCVENEYGKFGNFKFKANFTDEWIYPELLNYSVGATGINDYAIFYSDKINSGLVPGENTIIKYTLGQIDRTQIQEIGGGEAGESGSPIININGEVVAILTTSSFSHHTKINEVLQAIDNLK